MQDKVESDGFSICSYFYLMCWGDSIRPIIGLFIIMWGKLMVECELFYSPNCDINGKGCSKESQGNKPVLDWLLCINNLFFELFLFSDWSWVLRLSALIPVLERIVLVDGRSFVLVVWCLEGAMAWRALSFIHYGGFEFIYFIENSI